MEKVNLEKAMNSRKRERMPNWKWQEKRDRILKRDNYQCQAIINGKKCLKYANEVDHIIAIILGGTDDDENLNSKCNGCHKKKTAEDIEKKRRIRQFKLNR